MKVLVLGGTRFVGRAIVEALLPGHEVTVLNRGTRPLWDERIGQLVADRLDRTALTEQLDDGFQAIVDVSGTEPEHITTLLGALPAGAAPAYVYISSAAVYDRTRALAPFAEDAPADGDPVWGGYGEAKAACEQLLRAGVAGELTILRPPYVYGPHNTEPREQFLWARLLSGSPVFVPGDGERRIQFCHAEDLAATVLAACEGRLAAGTYNIGEPRHYGFREYLRTLAEVAGVEPVLLPAPDAAVPAREYFPFRDIELTLDTKRLEATDAFHTRPLATGLATSLAWFRDHDALHDEPTPREAAWRATVPR
ncbi:NAD-dependent epimerase/dehydratase family protein [Kitasatospora acidiphila]|uniref:NAD-dependent epimerase/dehydratase family protein n=1 Tax=Kitasatospora acidiphila TaxID=2567942 RepID=UPI003C70F14F